jgi:putative flavoprotein involved in K+ transport
LTVVERIDVLVVGAGSAGLAASYHLTQANVDHVVVDRSQVGQGWRDRWESFCLVTPNWTVQLPGFGYDGNDPDGFLLRDEIVDHLERYAASFSAPLRLGVEVTALRRNGAGYVADTSHGSIEAQSVIVATGAFQLPRIPPMCDQLPSGVHQLHSSQYRDPESLPDGAVLVVGSGQSGSQIAEELHEAGRRVVLAVGRAGRAPRRYRGRDTSAWITDLGLLEQTVEQLEEPDQQYAANMHVSGKRGGRTINLHAFARDGIRLVGKIDGANGGRLQLADDLHTNLAKADQRATEIRTAIDKHIFVNGIDAPDPDPADDYDGTDGFDLPLARELDLTAEGISTVLWATGYRPGFDWIELDVTDDRGSPIHQRGITEHPGLYFLGLSWLHKAKSGLLYGVGEDAAHTVDHLTTTSGRTPA